MADRTNIPEALARLAAEADRAGETETASGLYRLLGKLYTDEGDKRKYMDAGVKYANRAILQEF